MRFSKDKTPCNAHLHIAFSPVGKSRAGAAFMFGLDTKKMSVGTGVFAFDKKYLDVFRKTIAGPEGKAVQAMLDKLSRTGASISEPDLKRVPPGFDPDYPRADLLRHKGLAAWFTYDDTGLATRPGIAAQVAKDFKKLKPLMDWLEAL